MNEEDEKPKSKKTNVSTAQLSYKDFICLTSGINTVSKNIIPFDDIIPVDNQKVIDFKKDTVDNKNGCLKDTVDNKTSCLKSPDDNKHDCLKYPDDNKHDCLKYPDDNKHDCLKDTVDNKTSCLKSPDDNKISCLINHFKLNDLKSIAKQHSLHHSGTKQSVAQRICTHFHKFKHCLTIQRIFRGHLVRAWVANGFIRHAKKCVNETDGYTLEPFTEIPLRRMICIRERINGHTYYYGFDVLSLIPVIKQTLDLKRQPVNIYTRNEIPTKTISKIILIYYLVRAQYPDLCKEIHQASSTDLFLQLRGTRRRAQPATQQNAQSVLAERHAKPVLTRIEDVFNEMHYLGNYVNSDWFKNLNVYECITFYEWLAEIWYNRMDISQTIRQSISPHRDPLSNTSMYDRWSRCNTPEDVLCVCIETMEYMVLDGVDEDSRKLGAMYVLCALTAVSYDTRCAFPWLYETIAY